MGTYIPFTEQQREQARMTDLATFLERCGETLKRSGSEQMWLDHGQKVTIRGNLWFHQYEQVGGDAIDFARRFYGMTYPEAVQLMLSMGVGTIREPVEPFAKKPLKILPKHDNMSRVYGYLLRRRGICKEVLDAFAYERYFGELFLIYPKNWVKEEMWPYGCWGAGIFLLEMTLIFGIFFAFRAGRRLRQL